MFQDLNNRLTAPVWERPGGNLGSVITHYVHGVLLCASVSSYVIGLLQGLDKVIHVKLNKDSIKLAFSFNS